MIVIDHVDYWSLSEAYHLDRLHASVIIDWYPRYIHKPGALNIKQNVLSMLQETGRDWSLIQHADIEMKAKLIFITFCVIISCDFLHIHELKEAQTQVKNKAPEQNPEKSIYSPSTIKTAQRQATTKLAKPPKMSRSV